jgi:3-dehydroquinate dehydratase II
MKIIIINGPNMNLLGKREPDVYGTVPFETYFEKLCFQYSVIDLEYFQSNVEGEIIDKLQEVDFGYDGIILNAGGYTHTSVAIGDAVASIKVPVIEVHISNIYAREEYRHVSCIAKHCKGVIIGFGLDSYLLAIESFLK